ncbi:MAG: MBL fold metallo-hydrolase [Proteobacteria bacterium]|nr:MBL fold metallo-hydrolase [Pseudomonadota bacterium]
MRTLSSVMGNRQRLDGGAMFGNAPKAVWSRWAAPDALNRIDLACRALLIQESGKNVLLETGIGSFFEPKLADRYGVFEAEHVLLESLRQRGLTHEDIDVVVLSHLHFDHAGGLLSAYIEGEEPQLLFPNATFVVGESAWERAMAPHPRDRASFLPKLNTMLEQSGRLEIVHEQSKVLGDGLRFHVSHGHTPGLLVTEIAMPAGPVVFAADLIPGAAWVHTPITMGYDRFPEQLIDEKTALLAELIARGGRLFFTHDPNIALAELEQDGRGRFRATNPQTSLDGLTQ